MRIRMDDEREDRLRRLQEATGEKTKAGTIDVTRHAPRPHRGGDSAPGRGRRRPRPVNAVYESMRAAVSTFLNIGPTFGIAGPYANYQEFPTTTKVAMIVLMGVGRLDVIPSLVLLTASFWRS